MRTFSQNYDQSETLKVNVIDSTSQVYLMFVLMLSKSSSNIGHFGSELVPAKLKGNLVNTLEAAFLT